MRKNIKYKPAVTKTVLVFLAGIVWIGVGIMLLILAFTWLSNASLIHMYVYVIAGFVSALVIHHFGFLKIVDKNLERILPMDEKKCLFAFITWKSYLIIVIMVAMGITLRHSPIPKQYLAILYSGIGLALILSSIRYMRVFVREVRQ